MKISLLSSLCFLLLAGAVVAPAATAPTRPARHTHVTLAGEAFVLNGEPTFKGRTWRGHRVEGLLPNARMVQGIFDDANPTTRARWVYPDTQTWDPERNTREFIAAMPEWGAHGLLGFTINLQGGSPLGYGNQGWINSAFHDDGTLRPEYFARLEQILDRADELGMVAIVGLFYFGQDERLRDEAAVLQATDLTLGWLFDRGYRHVVIEVCNETAVRLYDHAVLQPAGVPALLRRVRETTRDGHRFPVGVSLLGGELPSPEIVANSDVVLVHGNDHRGVATTPARIREMVAQIRQLPGWRPMPIVFNEDDHYDFAAADNNYVAAIESGASWGYFDFRRQGEDRTEGFQSVPVDWGISSPRKRAFFELTREIFLR